MRLSLVGAVACLLLSLSVSAAELEERIRECSGVHEDSRRLACFDGLAATLEAKPNRGTTVTKAAFDRIETGMTYGEVAGVIGAPGELLSENDLAGTRSAMYAWKNPDGSNMNALFSGGRLVQKAQFGLR